MAHAPLTLRGLLRKAPAAALVVLLTACVAGHDLHRGGLTLMEQGRPEEGLALLDQAVRAAPGNVSYRADLVRSREQTVAWLLAAAAGERAAGNAEAARQLYERVLAIEPGQERARLGLELLDMDARHAAALDRAEALMRQGDLDGAGSAVAAVLQENPRHVRAAQLKRRVAQESARQAAAEPKLGSQFARPVTLQFRDANLKMVFEALSRTTGVNVLLDRDVRPDVKTTIFVKDVSVEDVLDLILLQNQLGKKVVSTNTLLVYPLTPAKLKEYQDLKVRSFHLTHADPKQMLTMLKSLLKTRDVFINEKTNSLVIRDTADGVRLAEKLVADQDTAQPEVMLEVEVLEVSTSRLTELGILWPASIGLATPSSAATLGDVRALGFNDLLVTPLSATLNLRLEDGDTNVLARPRIRVRNREKAKVMIGSRVPVMTNAVTPVSTGTPVVTGSVQYLDVGLKLEVEPDINQDGEVVIKMGLDVSSIVREVANTQSGTLAYEIGTRNANTVLRLRDGETQVLAGLINDEERRTANKIPGLGDIPVVGALFGSHKRNGGKSEIVLSITPRLVGSGRVPDSGELEYWAGTEQVPRNGLLTLRPGGEAALSATTLPASAAGPGSSATQRAAAATALWWEGAARVKPGERFNVALNVRASQPIGRLALGLEFDPAVMKPVDVVEGPFAQKGALAFAKQVDAAGGDIRLEVAGRGAEGARGAGVLATIVFEAIAPGADAHVGLVSAEGTGPGGEPLAIQAPPPHAVKVAP